MSDPRAATRRWTARDAAARARTILAEEGPRAVAARALSDLCYRRLRVIERPLAEPIPSLPPPPGVAVVRLAGAELTATAIGVGRDECAAVRRREVAGDVCFALVDEREGPVHRCWVSIGVARFPFLGLQAPVAPGAAYVYDAVTPECQRGRGLSAIRSAAMLAALREEGLVRAVSAILPENRAALAPPGRVGYRPVGTVGVLWAGRRRRPFARIPAGILGPLEPLQDALEQPDRDDPRSRLETCEGART
jgi:hypothetical protein